MSTTPNENQSAQVNPYTAPKSHASLKIGKWLTTAIVLLVVVGFAAAGALAYWRFSKSDVSVSGAGIGVEREEIFYRSPISEPVPAEPVTSEPIGQAVAP